MGEEVGSRQFSLLAMSVPLSPYGQGVITLHTGRPMGGRTHRDLQLYPMAARSGAGLCLLAVASTPYSGQRVNAD